MRTTTSFGLLLVSTLALVAVGCGDDGGGITTPASGGAGGVAGGAGGGAGTVGKGGSSAGAGGGSTAGNGGSSAGTGGSSAGKGGGGGSTAAGTGGSAAGTGGTGGSAAGTGGTGGSAAGTGGTGGSAAGTGGTGGSAAGTGGTGGGAAGTGGTGGSAGGGGAVDPGSFVCDSYPAGTPILPDDITKLAEGFCARPASCCLFDDEAICKKYYTDFYSSLGIVRLSNADACLSALEAAKGTCDRPAICDDGAFGSSKQGAGIGQACGGAVGCSPCKNAGVSCSQDDDGLAAKRRCVAKVPVGLGQACDGGGAVGDVLRDCGDGLRCETEGSATTGTCVDDGPVTAPACIAAPPAEVVSYLYDLAAASCAAYAPCCAKNGQVGGSSACEALAFGLTVSDYVGAFDATRAAACLVETKAKTSCEASGFSFSFGALSDEDAPSNLCDRVFELASAQPPGGTCASTSDCQRPDRGTAHCVDKVCVHRTPGVEGDACVTSLFDGSVPTTSAICQPSDGLFCDATSKLCAKRRGLGGACDREAACESGLCLQGKCAAPLPVGGACTSEESCGATQFCDGAACQPKRANGEACDRSTACAGGVCVNGKCENDLGFAGLFFCR